MIPLRLAKGLEFDRVIVPDASARLFPDDELSRNRLYTTISRATREVTVMSRGRMTDLFEQGGVGGRFDATAGRAARAITCVIGRRGNQEAVEASGLHFLHGAKPCSISSSQVPVNSRLFFSAMSATATQSGRWNLRVLTFTT